MNRRPSMTRTAFGVSLMIVGASLVGVAQDEGVKQVQQLIKKANSVIESITAAKVQLQKTMEAYNAVLAPDVKDRRDAYKKLQKEMATSDKKRAEVSTRANEMNTEADKLFKSWEGSTAAISDPDLRQRSEQRLTAVKERFGEIRTNGQKASELYATFMKSLQDQVTFLGHDLNPSAVAALKPNAEKLNAQAQELFAAIDMATAAANDNISKLSAQ
jgi:ElaB/YqjD/DUF883 family membrane-anchored ribosome-binding protein